MKIISHRGVWKSPLEKNTLSALKRSLDGNFGFETDIRDRNNKLVISHDVTNDLSLELNDLLELINNDQIILAWNIKADGLINLILESYSDELLKQSVFFDMSIPETISYKKNNLPYLVRFSEYETFNKLYDDSKGVWIDSFENQWFDYELLNKVLDDNKYVFIVSAELHNRDNIEQWKYLKGYSKVSNEKVVLCTDYPSKAKEFFNGQN